MQIEHINVRSHCMSGPAELWEPVDWWSRGQQVLSRPFISQCVSQGQTKGEELVEVGCQGGRKQAGMVVRSTSHAWTILRVSSSCSNTHHWRLGIYYLLLHSGNVYRMGRMGTILILR